MYNIATARAGTRGSVDITTVTAAACSTSAVPWFERNVHFRDRVTSSPGRKTGIR